MRLMVCGALAILALFMIASTAHASVSAERKNLYQSLLRQPNDLGLNQQYANLCISENDYEAAIPALERLAMLQPSNALIRLRLGQMFRALGSEVMAQKYFTETMNHPHASMEVRAKAKGYLQ
ncbi:MAG: hypothetical protein J0M34_05630 [Alphaproteobacteria bacterium]|nr:hypothetical protein [Alphaproteobacteria bacterium]